MKKDIGSVLALYPTPAVVVGAMVDGKPTWTLVAHVGVIGHDRILVSLAKPHYINAGIKETGALSVNVVDEGILEQADCAGCVSGAKTDKSELFAWSAGADDAPLADEAKLTMECTVEDVYDTKNFDNFICSIGHTYADEEILGENGKIDYDAFKPVLFEMPGYTYLKTGETIAKCASFGKARA